MLLICAMIYLVFALIVFMLIWTSLIVAKRDDMERGYDLLEDRYDALSENSLFEEKGM